MPRHANLPFHLYVHVDNRALGPKLPPGTTAAIWHAVYARPGQVVMRIDPRYFRPAEVETLLGDPS